MIQKLYLSLFFLLCFQTSYAQQDVFNLERCEAVESKLSVFDIAVDAKNQVWLATAKGIFKLSSFTEQEQITKGNIAYATATADGEVLVGLDNGNVVSGAKEPLFSEITKRKNDHITCMDFKDGELWVGTSTSGVYVYSITENKRIARYNAENSKLESDVINDILIDFKGSKWIATTEGVARLTEKGMKLYEKRTNITSLGMYIDDIWIAADGQFFIVNNKYRWVDVSLKKSMSKGKINDIAFDSKGRLYIASDRLVRYDLLEDTLCVYDKSYGFVDNPTLCLTADHNDNLWVGTQNDGLFRLTFSYNENFVDKMSAICHMEQEITCAGENMGALSVKVKGGTPPYKYKWNKSRARGEAPTNLPAGVYEVTITDSEGTQLTTSKQLDEPNKLDLKLVTRQRIKRKGAKNGSAVVEASGGTEPYTYKWDNGTTTAEAKKLPEGKIAVDVTDAKGCTASLMVDIQGEKLMPELEVSRISKGKTLPIKSLNFDADSTNFNRSSLIVLDEIVEFLEENPTIAIEVGGHTNNIPKDEYCDMLSTARAKAVAEYFYKNGISKKQISYKGYGKRNPISSNKTELGRKENQRVELKIL